MLTTETNEATTTDSWRKFFNQWPSELKREGIVVAEFGEQVPFDGFMIGGDILVLKRVNPDALGARQVMIPFSEIAAVKLIAPAQSKIFAAAGYEGSFSQR